jgi:hypothetical protein
VNCVVLHPDAGRFSRADAARIPNDLNRFKLMASQNSGTATLFMVVINHQHFFTIKVMNKFLPVSIGILLVLSNWSILPADAGRSRPSCNSTLKSVRSSLKNIRDVQMNPLGKRGQPAGRTKSLDLIFNRPSAPLATGQELSIAARVIKNCSNVGSVSFIEYQSDYGSVYGLVKSKVIEFTCKENVLEPARWGEEICL